MEESEEWRDRLSAFRAVPEDVLCSVYVVPDVIDAQREAALMSGVAAQPSSRWVRLSGRRLLMFGGKPHARGMVPEPIPEWVTPLMRDVVQARFLPGIPPLNHVLANEYAPGQGIMAHTDGPLYHPVVAIVSCGSHTVMDFYRGAGVAADYAGAGADAASVLSSRSDTTGERPASPMSHSSTASGGDARGLREHVCSVYIPRRSMLVFCDDAYTNCLHSIAERTSDAREQVTFGWPADAAQVEVLERTLRVSFTLRNVPRVLKGAAGILRAMRK